MKKQGLIGILVVVMVLLNVACGVTIPGREAVRGSGQVVEETREVGAFTGIVLSGIGTLHIETGADTALRIEAEDNLLPYFETVVRGDKLEISVRNGVDFRPTEPVNFYVTVVNLNSIDISGAGGVEAPALEAEDFSVVLSGAGNAHLDALDAQRLTAQLSGVGSLEIDEGAVETQQIEISGAGDYRARDVQSAQMTVQLSGVGSAEVWVRESLDVEISGAGSVRYRGTPAVEQDISGVGSLQRLGD